jgi:hypothetical protein
MFIFEHYFPLKLFADVCGTFISAYPDKEVVNETKHETVAILISVVHQLQQWDTAVEIQYCHCFAAFCMKVIICSS